MQRKSISCIFWTLFAGLLGLGGLVMAQPTDNPTVKPMHSDQYLYLLTPKAGVKEEQFERWVMEEAFPSVKLLRRNVRSTSHALFKTQNPEGKPQYLWRLEIELVSGRPSENTFAEVAETMKAKLEDYGTLSVAFTPMGLGTGTLAQKKVEFTHLVLRDTPYYLSGPQQGSPPEGKLTAGTHVRFLEEAGSYARVQSESEVVAYIAAGDIRVLVMKERKMIGLMQDLQSSDHAVRMNAAQSLGEMGMAATPAIPKLKKLAQEDPDEYVRHFAEQAIINISGEY